MQKEVEINTPVVIIGFNRPDYVVEIKKAVEGLKFNKLYFVVDGPRLGAEADEFLIKETISVMCGFKNARKVEFIISDKNLGCKRRVLSALNQLFSIEEKLIILEDDCVPTRDFFHFCEYSLVKYKDNQRVSMISGSNLLGDCCELNKPEGLSIFINCWGWAGWRSKTAPLLKDDIYLADISNSLEFSTNFRMLPLLIRCYWRQIFKHSISSNTIWDFYLQLALFRTNSYSLFPRANLVNNIGFGNSATHTKFTTPNYVLNNHATEGSFVAKCDDWVEYEGAMKERDMKVSKKLYQYSVKNLAKIIFGNIHRYVFKY